MTAISLSTQSCGPFFDERHAALASVLSLSAPVATLSTGWAPLAPRGRSASTMDRSWVRRSSWQALVSRRRRVQMRADMGGSGNSGAAVVGGR